MTVTLLHYRRWRGSFRGPAWACWPIARVALQMVLRRKLFWVVYGLGLMIFCVFFFGQYVLSWAATQTGESSIPVMGVRQNPQDLIRLLGDSLKLNGQDATYANYFWYQGYTVMVILALAGSLIIGNDVRHGSLPFYLSKPISRWHYLFGKGLALAVLINLLTTLPALLLYVEYGLLESWSYFETSTRLLLGILGYGTVLTVCLSLLLLATAILLRRTVPMIMAWATLFVFCRVLAGVLVDGMRLDARWRLLDLWNSAYVLGCACLGLVEAKVRPAPQPTWQEALLVLGVVCLLCLTYLIRRIQAVEIVR